MRTTLLLLALTCAAVSSAATIDNDASCDVAVLPAATLLLPYFEVDLDDNSGETTLFTVTNVTNVDRIARATLWTDRGYPVLSFNIYLTGYDVQAINLYDVISRGLIAPDTGTGTAVTARRSYSDPNHEIDLTGCARLPGALPADDVQRIKDAFTLGTLPALGAEPACSEAGWIHANAVGYATIDVVRTCSSHNTTDRQYWTEDIAFENALMGDFQQIDSRNNFAQSNPMVHIRAVPEGGTPFQRRARPLDFKAGFPRTFYSRYQAASEPGFDGRQPLPSTFAARWIQGGTAFFQTSYKIWREGFTAGASCEEVAREQELTYTEIVRFDEAENAVAAVPRNHPPGIDTKLVLPLTSRTGVEDASVYPQLTNGAVAGWTYLNLDKCGGLRSGCNDAFASQAWVVTSMRAQERFAGDMDAAALGNGCSPRNVTSEVMGGTVVIGPAANGND